MDVQAAKAEIGVLEVIAIDVDDGDYKAFGGILCVLMEAMEKFLKGYGWW